MQCRFTVNRLEDNRYRVMVRSVTGENPIGPRLARGEPLPVVEDTYDTEREATVAANMLQEYHDRYESKRGKKRGRKRR